ncbi:MAG: hypothetical protein KKI02_03735 [Planctomycetes bacterium]|nr:hypothetical protein [Planctomycetota bacterium]
MNCWEAEQFFDAYLDDELAGSLRLEFDAHRLRCTVCQQKLAMMESCEHILARDTGGPALSDGFTDRVMGDIEQRQVLAAHSRKRRLVIGGAVALQVAAVIVFAIFWTGYWNQPTPVLPPGEDPVFTDDVRKAMATGDRDALKELIWARHDQLEAARSNLRDEAAALAGYFRGLSIFGDYTPVSDAPPNPLNILIPRHAPPLAEEVEPDRDAAGSYSL